MNSYEVNPLHGSQDETSHMNSTQNTKSDLERSLQVEESKLLLMKKILMHQRSYSIKKTRLKPAKTTENCPKSPPIKLAPKKYKRGEDSSKRSEKTHHDGQIRYNQARLEPKTASELAQESATEHAKGELTDRINLIVASLPKLIIPVVEGLCFLPSLDSGDYLECVGSEYVKKHTKTRKSKHDHKMTNKVKENKIVDKSCPLCGHWPVAGWMKWKEGSICQQCHVSQTREPSRSNYDSILLAKLNKLVSLETTLNAVEYHPVVKSEDIPAQVVPNQANIGNDYATSMQQWASLLGNPLFMQGFAASYLGSMNAPGFTFPFMGNNNTGVSQSPSVPVLTSQQQYEILQNMLNFSPNTNGF